jgi:2-polyprenyl-3-methyl-5-hydroxy-6-metoxy-1,4-benzoquinol methylase
MSKAYNTYYQTADLFGEPHQELIAFFTGLATKGKVLDIGCGQGRNAIALARLGYEITGIDTSKVGIQQMIQIARTEDLNVTGIVDDIYTFENYSLFDVILLDSMYHFFKKDTVKEKGLLKNIVSNMKTASIIVVCIQDTGNKVQILNEAIDFYGPLSRLSNKKFKYTFTDSVSGTTSVSNYRMIVAEK